MNDLLDCASYTMKEINPQTGEKLQFQKEDGSFRDYTLTELKQIGKRAGQNVLGYRAMINNFLQKADLNMVRNGLETLEVNIVDIQNDVQNMKNVSDYIIANIDLKKSKEELKALADYIGQNVPKLTLVRRSWCLGCE